jgi:hypothetical protein
MERPTSAGVLIVMLSLAGLALLPPAQAVPKLESSTELRVDTPTSAGAADLHFKVVFTMAQDSQAYLKVSPRPGNPVFANGTAGQKGWWTHLRLEDGAHVSLFEGTTTGDPPSDFGDLKANVTYTLWLDAHAPAGALDHPSNYSMDYILAEHVASGASGSGGTLDESVSLHAVARVEGAAVHAGFKVPWWAWVAGAVAVVAGVAVAVALGRRGRRPGPPGKGA